MRSRLVLGLVVVLCVGGVARAEDPAADWKFEPLHLVPFWTAQTMYGESVLFVREKPDGDAVASLLFEPTRIVSVTN